MSSRLFNTTKQNCIAEKVTIADTFLSRMVGLLNRSSLPKDEALIITRCNSIHMFFMRFAIDAVFVDKNHTVVGLVPRIKPFRLSRIFFRSSYVIELAAGVIAEKHISVGDTVSLEKS